MSVKGCYSEDRVSHGCQPNSDQLGGPSRSRGIEGSTGSHRSVLAAHTIGVYSVEVRPGFPETEAETQLEFGGNLARLRSLRQRCDPKGRVGVRCETTVDRNGGDDSATKTVPAFAETRHPAHYGGTFVADPNEHPGIDAGDTSNDVGE